jgi:transcriptional regulator with XRE-family HTH domain
MTEKQLLKKIGLRIKQLRTEKGLSQADFGLEINVEKSNVSRMESGRFNTKIHTLYRVAEAFELSLSDLLDKIEK